MTPLRVSDNRRFLVHDDAVQTPFFYLGDTAWELFHRLTREEATFYLENRAAKGFTVIQAVALAEFDGLNTPNAYGEKPLIDNDPTRPNDAYFAHIDWVIDEINRLGMFVGLLPTWGDKYHKRHGAGPEIFTPENARIYAEWLAKRYADSDVIWILGGDRDLTTETHVAIITAMAEGIRTVCAGRQRITFHPCGQETSSKYFHKADWLDFNMYQTGHTFDRDSGRSIAEDYALTDPIKPCMDAEPGYEDHPSGWKPETGYLDSYECRKFLYWDLFAGAFGHTYGCHDIWQFLDAGRTPVSLPRHFWREAINFPGAFQMHIAKDLLLDRPYLSRIPASDLIVSDRFTGTDTIAATMDSHGTYAMTYSASGKSFTLDMSRLSGNLRGQWLDPRTGAAHDCGIFTAKGNQTFTPPTSGRRNDWLLLLDVEK